MNPDLCQGLFVLGSNPGRGFETPPSSSRRFLFAVCFWTQSASAAERAAVSASAWTWVATNWHHRAWSALSFDQRGPVKPQFSSPPLSAAWAACTLYF